ncbi:alpha/beta hydrolase [Micromonospora sp. CPCC 206061]|uniref:alpha/beta hydrolase n=1 Tax=Micromonospora sp. CPCC 206061 TaxID=3122410 RepID=UPI002FEEBE57
MRTTGKLIALALVTTVLVPPSAAAAAPKPPPYVPRIAWGPCVDAPEPEPFEPPAQCGTLTVPIDWSQPSGATMKIAVARRPALDSENRIGSLVVNPGGPGGSGVDFALWNYSYFSEELRNKFDIVGFDPRGVARSQPVVCGGDLLLKFPSPLIETRGEFQRRGAYNQALGNDCRSRTGPLFDHVDTISVARDIEAIRHAVGDRKLTYYGVSYGTLMGQQYAELYPGKVRALALDSNMDHSLDTAAFLETEAASAQDSFDEFVKGCNAEPACPMYGQDISAVWRSLLVKADNGDLTDPDDPTWHYSALDLIGFAYGSFYGPDWFFLADTINWLNGGSSQPQSATVAEARTALRAYAPIDEAYEYPFPAVFCEDWALPLSSFQRYTTLMAQQRAVAPDMRFSPLGLDAAVTCHGWPAKPNNPQHPLNVPATGNKLLLINNLHDPATGYNWALGAAGQLGAAATLLTYEGWGHGSYARTPCIDNAVDAYLVSLTLPAPGTSCPAAEPFAATNGARATGTTGERDLPSGPRPGRPGWSR